jgi:hypothetical protein
MGPESKRGIRLRPGRRLAARLNCSGEGFSTATSPIALAEQYLITEASWRLELGAMICPHLYQWRQLRSWG